jgi:hypothetical protein
MLDRYHIYILYMRMILSVRKCLGMLRSISECRQKKNLVMSRKGLEIRCESCHRFHHFQRTGKARGLRGGMRVVSALVVEVRLDTLESGMRRREVVRHD